MKFGTPLNERILKKRKWADSAAIYKYPQWISRLIDRDLIISEVRVYKPSALVSLHCLSYRNVTELWTSYNVLQNNKTVFYRLRVTLFWPLQLGNTTLILYKDDFEFVSEIQWLLGHPAFKNILIATILIY